MTQKVISGVYNGVTTVELDTLAAETAASMTTKHPDYAILAARIAVSNLHKETKKVFSGELFHTALLSFAVLLCLWKGYIFRQNIPFHYLILELTPPPSSLLPPLPSLFLTPSCSCDERLV